MNAVDAVADLANRRSEYMTDPAANIRRSRHGQLRLDGRKGIDSYLRTSAIACAASRAWAAFSAIRSR